MQKWEYTVKFNTRKGGVTGTSKWSYDWSLTEMGEQGWELVAVLPIASATGAMLSGTTTEIEYIFKRPKET